MFDQFFWSLRVIVVIDENFCVLRGLAITTEKNMCTGLQVCVLIILIIYIDILYVYGDDVECVPQMSQMIRNTYTQLKRVK